jgi:thioredoxin reductase (NADPH)
VTRALDELAPRGARVHRSLPPLAVTVMPDQSGAGALDSPVLFIVDADDEARRVTESALLRRFGADYRVLTAATAKDGLEALGRLADGGESVVLIAADLHLPGMDGIQFLDRTHRLRPGASRVLLVAMDEYHTRIPFTELPTLQRATALGRIDFSVAKGWTTPEVWLYPQVHEALTPSPSTSTLLIPSVGAS